MWQNNLGIQQINPSQKIHSKHRLHLGFVVRPSFFFNEFRRGVKLWCLWGLDFGELRSSWTEANFLRMKILRMWGSNNSKWMDVDKRTQAQNQCNPNIFKHAQTPDSKSRSMSSPPRFSGKPGVLGGKLLCKKKAWRIARELRNTTIKHFLRAWRFVSIGWHGRCKMPFMNYLQASIGYIQIFHVASSPNIHPNVRETKLGRLSNQVPTNPGSSIWKLNFSQETHWRYQPKIKITWEGRLDFWQESFKIRSHSLFSFVTI